nr:NAD-dependent epimerase/dehydratase family protein [Bradyrhizobium sp. CW4]
MAGVRQFIFISTVLVHGRTNDGRAPFSEDDVLTPRGLYGMSKAAAEAGLKTLARDSAMKISVIRPPLVYGAGAKGNFALLTRAVNLGLALPFAEIRNQRAFLALQNLSSFILRRLSHPVPPAISRSSWWPISSRSRRPSSSRVWPRLPARTRGCSACRPTCSGRCCE